MSLKNRLLLSYALIGPFMITLIGSVIAEQGYSPLVLLRLSGIVFVLLGAGLLSFVAFNFKDVRALWTRDRRHRRGGS